MNQVQFFFEKPDNYLHKHFGVDIRADLVRELIPNDSRSILDVGCGDGGVSWQFIHTKSVTFLDFSSNMIDLVRQRAYRSGINNINLVVGSVFEFKPLNRFDVVLAIGVIAHVPSVSEFVVYVKQFLLKPGGVLILQFSDGNSFLTKLSLRRNSTYNYRRNLVVKEFLESQLLINGFVLERSLRYGLIFPGMGLLPDRFLYRYSKFIIKSGVGKRVGSEYILKAILHA